MTLSAEFLVRPKVVTAAGVVRIASLDLPLIFFALVRSLFVVLNVLVFGVDDEEADGEA